MNITNAISTQATAAAIGSNSPTGDPHAYATTSPADAVALLNERLAAETDAFTHATGLKLAAVKVKRDKESDDYRLECHVRS